MAGPQLALAVALLAPGAALAQSEPAPRGGPAATAVPSIGRATRMRLEDCIRIAATESDEIERADARIAEARAQKLKLRGRFGPVLHGEANVMRWDKATEFSLDLPAELTAFVGPLPPWIVQDATTYQASLTLVQPVAGLWAIYEGYNAMSLGEQAATYERASVTSTTAEKVADAYFLALTAEQYAEIAQTGVDTIGAHVARARVLEKAEVIGYHQVLEAEVKLAEAEAQLIQAREGVELTRSNLAFTMGRSPDHPVIPEPLSEQDLPAVEEDYDAALHTAMASRPDVAAMRARTEQADAGVRAAWAQMLPELNVLAGAMFMKGSQFQRESQYFVGAQAKWNLWEWGATYYGIEEAEARERQALSGLGQLEDGVRLELRKAQSDLRTAKRQLGVTRRAVAQAEENLRIVQARFDRDVGTSTDVLDAVALLQKAKMTEATTLHSAFRAAYVLRRATGRPPVAQDRRATAAAGPRREP
jgi:outer membrane protein TolC